jgi:hypothetical protein
MRGTRRRLVSLGAVTVALIAPTLMATAHAGAAVDWGPPPGGEIHDCTVWVDPPAAVLETQYKVWTNVSNVTVDGVLIDYNVSHPYTDPGVHLVEFPLTGIPAVMVPGPHHIRAEARWNIGHGVLVLEGTVTCVEAPPTSPPTTAPPTTPPPTVAPTTAPPPTVLGTTVVPVTQKASSVSVEANTATNANDDGQLPFTGGGTGPLLFLGLGCVAGGVAIVRAFRRHAATR